MIDYRDLLLKYIAHIGEEKSAKFIAFRGRPDFITAEEWAELERMDGESLKYAKKYIR